MDANIQLEATYNGKPIEVLKDLIEKRSKALRETTEESVTATAINVLTSLKASTRKAPMSGNRKMYTLRPLEGVVAGWATSKSGKHRRAARNGNIRGPVDWGVTNRCRNLAGQMHVKGEVVKVFKAQLKNENLSETVYYAFAKNEGQVRDYIENVILARLLKKESGMAKYAIGIAQAKVSNRPMNVVKPTGAKQWKIAYDAGKITVASTGGVDSGSFSIEFFDDLDYSSLALKGGGADVETAMMKAANKTAGLIHVAYVNKAFDEDVQTPFPEVKARR